MRMYRPTDYSTILAWYTARQMPVTPETSLPPTGFIVEGVAASFLYTTASDVAFLEGSISNPDTTREQRTAAALEIGHALESYCREHEIRHILTFASLPAAKERTLAWGFKDVGTYTMFEKEVA